MSTQVPWSAAGANSTADAIPASFLGDQLERFFPSFFGGNDQSRTPVQVQAVLPAACNTQPTPRQASADRSRNGPSYWDKPPFPVEIGKQVLGNPRRTRGGAEVWDGDFEEQVLQHSGWNVSLQCDWDQLPALTIPRYAYPAGYAGAERHRQYHESIWRLFANFPRRQVDSGAGSAPLVVVEPTIEGSADLIQKIEESKQRRGDLIDELNKYQQQIDTLVSNSTNITQNSIMRFQRTVGALSVILNESVLNIDPELWSDDLKNAGMDPTSEIGVKLFAYSSDLADQCRAIVVRHVQSTDGIRNSIRQVADDVERLVRSSKR